MTNITTTRGRLRSAMLLALTLGIAAGGALPVLAASKDQGATDFGLKTSQCLSRQEVKRELQDMHRLTHIDVSRTGDHSIYRISGYIEVPKRAAVADSGIVADGASPDSGLLSGQATQKVRYIALFSACEDRVVRVITPDEAK